MRNFFGVALAAALLCPTTAQAVVVVNSVVGEDLDGLPPFESVMAGVNYAIATEDPVVQIDTNEPSGTVFMLPDSIYLSQPLTIRAGAGFTPVFTTGIRVIPANTDTTVTLEGLHVNNPAGIELPLWASGLVEVRNCTFRSNAGVGNYLTGVTAATGGRGTTGTLIMENCYIEGHNGLQAGRSIENYYLTSCTIVGQSDLDPGFSAAITNVMNWSESFGFRIDPAFGSVSFLGPDGTLFTEPYQTIQTPRNIYLDRCVVRGGTMAAWPPITLSNTYYANESRTHGNIVATNTVFEGLNPITMNTLALHEDQDFGGSFTHCTFRGTGGGAIRFQFGFEDFAYNFTNNLFDVPNALYGIGIGDTARPTISGDGNVYYTPADKEYVLTQGELADWTALAPFEATTNTYAEIAPASPNITLPGGVLPRTAAVATAKAVAMVPPLLVDKDNQPRPQPLVALLSDVGADEVDESDTSDVADWNLF